MMYAILDEERERGIRLKCPHYAALLSSEKDRYNIYPALIEVFSFPELVRVTLSSSVVSKAFVEHINGDVYDGLASVLRRPVMNVAAKIELEPIFYARKPLTSNILIIPTKGMAEYLKKTIGLKSE